MNGVTLWKRYQDHLIRFGDERLAFSLDISRMQFSDSWLESMEVACQGAFDELAKLEAGEPVNADENRMVGHYWLRQPDLAPSADLCEAIRSDLAAVKSFAAAVHSGEVSAEAGGVFKNLLLIGIGGSALGPQLVEDALVDVEGPMRTWFFDNTDPDGMDRVLREIGRVGLAETLVVVTSKSGGTPETRNGMLEARRAFQDAGLSFAKHAVAITGEGSQLDQVALQEGWVRRFEMADWVGGRTSVMSVVGLVPAALQGVDIDAFLAGAAAMDERTRIRDTRRNPAMMLSLMWHHAGNGRGEKDMVVLPYKDRLLLFSRYLQQLVMESLGKEFKRGNEVRVEQGIAVYGNKGSTDQHAYVQQLRDGLNNFFAIFIEVEMDREGPRFVVDESNGASSGDYLQGFLRGTRAALEEKGRESITLSIGRVDAYHLGALIALFERTVTFYASLVDVNAYHQPGVEAGKKAAGAFLETLQAVRERLEASPAQGFTCEELAEAAGEAPETVYHALNHLAGTGEAKVERGARPGADRFQAVSGEG